MSLYIHQDLRQEIDSLLLLLWRTCYNNIIQTICRSYEEFPTVSGGVLRKDHAKDVIRNDFREKIQAIHEMLLKSWPHMVPPQFEHIHLPAGHLTDGMLSPIWDDGIEPLWGFVEPPSLKPNTEPCSVEDYFGSDYWDRDRVVNGNDISALLADYLSDNSSYNPLDPIHGMENSSTFLSDFMEMHGQKGYHDVFEMFPNLLSELELEYEI